MRHVPLNSTALAALAELRKRGDSTGLVIRNVQGEPLVGPRHWFEPAIRKAGILGLSWHCLRHTFASRLAMARVDLPTVQDLLGHKSIAMTVCYSHLSPSHTLAAVERLAEPVSETQGDSKTSTYAPSEIQQGTSYLQ